MIAELHEIYATLSENASKFLLGTSSQGNESMNNTMASKSNKRLCYSKSESADFRFACTVAQKIFGEAYLLKVFEKHGYSWTSDLEDHVQHTTTAFKRRKERQNTPEEKKKRIKRVQTRSQLKNRKEAVEENTYCSDMSLFDKPQEVCQGINNPEEVCQFNDCMSKNFHIIFYDMETGGLNMSKYDILQIAMKVDDSTFSSYITPRRMIHSNRLPRLQG